MSDLTASGFPGSIGSGAALGDAALVLMTVWKNFGYNMIVFLAGLQAVPGELYDAAASTAPAWQRFRIRHAAQLAPTFLSSALRR